MRRAGKLRASGPPSNNHAFTLLEVLVVIAIIVVLAIVVISAMSSGRDAAHRAACVSNLRQIGAAIIAYASENEGKIPYGPKAPPYTSPSNLYPSTGTPTSLISLRQGEPVGLGILLEKHLEKTPKVLFCPGCDNPLDAAAELAKVGTTQAQCSYYYRHAGNTQLFDNPRINTEPSNLGIFNLGNNRNGRPVRALVMDTVFLCPDGLDQFNVLPRQNHRGKFANVLFADGHVRSFANDDARFTVNVSTYSQLRASFTIILEAFERADQEE